jgi:hypothetical protein
MRKGHELFSDAFRNPQVASADLGDIGDVRTLLADIGCDFTDAQIEDLRDQARRIADAFFNTWLKRRGLLATNATPGDNRDDGEAPPPIL